MSGEPTSAAPMSAEAISLGPTNADAEESGAAEFGTPSFSLRGALREHERALIKRALRHTGGNQRQAAALLSLPLRTLERKVQKHALQTRERRYGGCSD